MTRATRALLRSPGPIALVLATIALQLVSAWLLAGVAQRKGLIDLLAIAAIGLCIVLNLVRFVVWRVIHRRYPLSHVYPLTALFFPLIVALSYSRGDPVTIQQWAGTALITVGALVLAPARATSTETP